MEGVISLSAEQVQSVLLMEVLIPAMEKGLAEFSKGPDGGIVQPVRTSLTVEKSDGFFGVMPAYSASDDTLACKIVTFFPSNTKLGMPSHHAQILLYDARYGKLKAFMDGEVITGMRTAAASAAATKHLVPQQDEKSLKLAILGAGVQARTHCQALKTLYKFSEIRIWSRTMESAMKCAEEVGGEACLSAEEAVNDADIIVTATSSKAPILKSSWIKPGAHINAVGAAMKDAQEMDPQLMLTAVVYADSKEAAYKEAGDVILSKAEVYAEIGEVINGSKEIKRGDRGITIFKSLGLGVEDAISAKIVYDAHMSKLSAGDK